VNIRKAILSGNAEELLQYISATQGLTCTDTQYSYTAVTRFPKNKHSYPYMSLFDSGGFARACRKEYPADYPAIYEFLKTANDNFSIEADAKF
jgi:hypothetical protein